eukprot:1781454-Rhodomonas_salina.1
MHTARLKPRRRKQTTTVIKWPQGECPLRVAVVSGCLEKLIQVCANRCDAAVRELTMKVEEQQQRIMELER